MKAYKCDICGSYEDGLPVGVLYDNDVRDRTDICPSCLDAIEKHITSMETEPRDISSH